MSDSTSSGAFSLENIQRFIAISLVAVSAIAWAVQMQLQTQYVLEDLAEIKSDLRSLKSGTQDRWTRTNHDTFYRDTFAPLERRVHALELRD